MGLWALQSLVSGRGNYRIGLYQWLLGPHFIEIQIAGFRMQFSAWWVAAFTFTLLVGLCIGIFFGMDRTDRNDE